MNIWIVIPCYNEEKRFEASVIIDFIQKNDFHFCLVNDGSKDNTIKLLDRVKEESNGKVRIINLRNNVGKAEAIRIAFQEVLEHGGLETPCPGNDSENFAPGHTSYAVVYLLNAGNESVLL